MAEPDRLQPGEPVAAAGAAKQDRQLVADELAATAGEDGRTIGETRPVLLPATGGEPPDAAAVRKHAAADRRAALADRIGGRGGEANRSEEGGGGEGAEKPLGMRHFWVFRARARQSWSPSSAAGLARDGKDGENALTEASGCIIDGGQEAKIEILVYTAKRRNNEPTARQADVNH